MRLAFAIWTIMLSTGYYPVDIPRVAIENFKMPVPCSTGQF